jgi:WD40 repeat protein
VSGCFHKTIRVWDAETGEIMLDPFEGHADTVSAVTFSPDGKSIASGSHDHTIRVWDAETGAVISGPFKGHSYFVMSIDRNQ